MSQVKELAITQAQEQLRVAAAQVSAICATVIVVESSEDRDNAVAFLKDVKTKSKLLNERRKEVTGELDATKKQVMALFRPFLMQLEEKESAMKQDILKYDALAEQEAKERQAKADAEAAKIEAKQREELESKAAEALAEGDEAEAIRLAKEADDHKIKIKATEAPEPEEKGANARLNWSAEILDIKKIPDSYKKTIEGLPEYKKVCQKFFNQLAKQFKGGVEVEGVEFKCEKTLTVRTK